MISIGLWTNPKTQYTDIFFNDVFDFKAWISHQNGEIKINTRSNEGINTESNVQEVVNFLDELIDKAGIKYKYVSLVAFIQKLGCKNYNGDYVLYLGEDFKHLDDIINDINT